jgi:hypothetical protein
VIGTNKHIIKPVFVQNIAKSNVMPSRFSVPPKKRKVRPAVIKEEPVVFVPIDEMSDEEAANDVVEQDEVFEEDEVFEDEEEKKASSDDSGNEIVYIAGGSAALVFAMYLANRK